ncbi:MAG: acyl carrier protein [Defluviitaleaceae bacterium]|nr:acyl carrier protein [Defluviitaleaceae bacterium]
MEFEKIIDVIVEQTGIEREKIKLESNFTEDLGLDSLDLFQIITELENLYKVNFDLSNADKIKIVNDAVEYIKQNT